MMMTELMLERTAADRSIVVPARERLVAKPSGATSEERLAAFLDCERLATMPLPALLYYVLMKEERSADELA